MKKVDRRNNIYSSGVVDQNARNSEILAIKASEKLECEVKIVPTDIFGNILTSASVTINEETATVDEFGNIALVDYLTDVDWSVECEGYETVSGSIKSIRQSELITPILSKQSVTPTPPPVPEAPVATPASVSLVKAGTAQTVTFDKNIETLAAQETAEWLTVQETTPTEWSVSATDNGTSAPREATLLATAEDGSTTTVAVTQAAE